MIRSAVIGLWVCAVTIAGGYAGTKWLPEEKHSDAAEGLGKTTLIKLRQMSVPVVIDSKVSGYIVCQFSILALADVLKTLAVKPDGFIFDAVFKGIYTGSSFDITKINKDSWPDLANSIKSAVNERYGREILRDVVLEDFTFVPAEMARKGGELPSDNHLKPRKGKSAH